MAQQRPGSVRNLTFSRCPFTDPPGSPSGLERHANEPCHLTVGEPRLSHNFPDLRARREYPTVVRAPKAFWSNRNNFVRIRHLVFLKKRWRRQRCLRHPAPAKAGDTPWPAATGRPRTVEHSKPSCRAPTLRFGSAALPTHRVGPRAARSRRAGARNGSVVHCGRLTPVCKEGVLCRTETSNTPAFRLGVPVVNQSRP